MSFMKKEEQAYVCARCNLGRTNVRGHHLEKHLCSWTCGPIVCAFSCGSHIRARMTENLRTHHFVTEKPVHHSHWTTIPLPASTSSSGP